MELDVLAKIVELQACSRSELLEQWQEWFGKNAPRYISQQLLMRGIAYKIQEKAYGGLAADVKRALDFSTKENRRQKSTVNATAKISSDTTANLTDTLIYDSEGHHRQHDKRHASSAYHA